jgi:hypothetical protein
LQQSLLVHWKYKQNTTQSTLNTNGLIVGFT